MQQDHRGAKGRSEQVEAFTNLAAARKWFDSSVFNLAVDYWTFVLCRPYGSAATRENILPVLKALRPGFLQIYAKGETGHTSFRCSLGSEHPGLAKDLPSFYRAVTRETGTKLFLYWSGLEDGVAAQRHPDWRMLGTNGEPALCFADLVSDKASCSIICPQSAFLDEWVAIQLREVFAMSDPDGMWIDGTWVGPCYCSRCVGRFRTETGFNGDIPSGVEWGRYWAKVLYEFRARFIAVLRALKPSFLASFGNITPRAEFREDRDWLSGDWYSPNFHRLQQSISMRRYTTTGLPSEAWICDTQVMHAWYDVRARSKTLPRILQEGAGILANGGRWTYWTFPMPHGALVPSRMRKAKVAARFARERKHLVLQTRSAQWTAILDMEPKNMWFGDNLWGAGKALIHLHRSPDLMEENRLADDMPYDLIVAPEQPVITADTVGRLEAFVRRGGKLLSTGVSILSPDLQRLLGVRLVQRGAVEEGHVFLRNGEPAGVYAPWDKLELIEAKGLYPLHLSWDDANPEMRKMRANLAITGLVDEERPEKAGFPAATARMLGKGMAVHIPVDIFGVYWRFGYPDILAWLREILSRMQPSPLFHTDAPCCVEVSLRRKKDALLVHLVNGNPGRDTSLVNGKDLWVDDIPAIGAHPVRDPVRGEAQDSPVGAGSPPAPVQFRKWRAVRNGSPAGDSRLHRH